MGKLDSIMETQSEQGQVLAALKQRSDDTHERIFGGPSGPGVLKYLADQDLKLASALENASKEFKAAVDSVKADIVELKTEKRVTKAYAAGAVGIGTTLGYLIKAGFLKVALMFAQKP